MELKGQWGKVEKKNKRARGNIPQQANFNDLEFESYIMTVILRECSTWWEADRWVRVLQLRESRRRYAAGLMNREPPSLHLHKATQEDEADFLQNGGRYCRSNNPLKKISRHFCPSKPIRDFMDKHWPRK